MASIYERRENGDGTISQNVAVTDSDYVQQTDVQYRRQSTSPHMTGQVVANGATGEPTAWIDTDGWDKIAFTLVNDAAVSSTAHVLWSNDGIAIHGITVNIMPVLAQKERETIVETRAKWAKLRVANNDASPRTFNAWSYRKV